MEFKYVYTTQKYCEDCGRKKVAAIPASHWRDIEVLDCMFCNNDFSMDINRFLINYEYDTKTDSYKKRVR
tara:strand:+ start:3138 stop:3347 length:210 start_codon:yes stop_codon:yes gene_type:complete